MSFSVVVTDGFKKHAKGIAKKHRSFKSDLISACAKTHVSDEKSPSSRLAKSEKTQFTYVIEYFSDKHNEEIGVFAQTLIKLIDSLEENPTQCEALGKDCYKVCMAITSKGKGKSGDARVITCVKVVNQTAYLLTIYDKSDKENISDKELDELLRLAELL